MNRITLLCFLLLAFSSCWPCDDPVVIDFGKIPDSILAYVPYQNGQNYKFRHSGGKVIGFSTVRQSREEWQRCERCCKFEYRYEVNTTTLIPDYPIFNFSFDLSNIDSVNYGFGASVGRYWFQIPTNDYQAGYSGFADSLLVGDKFYHGVFKLKSNYGSAYDRDTIFADSMYYSYQHGLIQVMMSNGEKYTIYE